VWRFLSRAFVSVWCFFAAAATSLDPVCLSARISARLIAA
jgi:hypothetical protein